METLIQAPITETIFAPIYIGVECKGESDYEFLQDDFEVFVKEQGFHFDLQAYSDGNGNDRFYVENVRPFEGDDYMDITDDEHQVLAEKIESAMEINEWS